MENIENKPYPWIHEYDIMLSKNKLNYKITYVIHSDYKSCKDRRAIAELKHRLTFGYNGYKIKQIHYKPKKTRVNRYLFKNKEGM